MAQQAIADVSDKLIQSEEAEKKQNQALEEIKALRQQISSLQAQPTKIRPDMSLRDDGYDDQNVDLLQLANASYLAEINKYNAVFA